MHKTASTMKAKVLSLVFILIAATFPYKATAQKYKANYDEAKVPEYTLPEVLVSESGKKIKTVRQWERKRRPELLSLFEREMFGIMPERPDGMHFEMTSMDKGAFDSLATRKEVTIYLDKDKNSRIRLLIYIPNGKDRPVPAFLGINFMGNHTTTDDPGVSLPTADDIEAYGPQYKPRERGEQAHRWAYRHALEQGYAVVTFYRGDVDPDFDDGFRNGVHPLMDGDAERTAESWGTIAAWAWGLSRALDYMETDADIDSRKVAVLGHSRLGKAAVWAGAYDTRFAAVISNNSGCGGAAISRRQYGETVKIINSKFPHWFCENFRKYNDNEAAMPFDQHQLLALVAPRPLYVASASLDRWADPKGELLGLTGASKVYELYGHEAFTLTTLPKIHCPVICGPMGYHIREGKHEITLYDWQQYIAFTDRFLK